MSEPAPVRRPDQRRRQGVRHARQGSTVALSGIDLDIAPGEFVSLIGPSGCGKSTLLRVIGDLVQPTRGTVGSTARRPSRRAATATTGWCSRPPSCSTGEVEAAVVADARVGVGRHVVHGASSPSACSASVAPGQRRLGVGANHLGRGGSRRPARRRGRVGRQVGGRRSGHQVLEAHGSNCPCSGVAWLRDPASRCPRDPRPPKRRTRRRHSSALSGSSDPGRLDDRLGRDPAIIEDLHADVNAVVWVTSAYLLAYAVPV